MKIAKVIRDIYENHLSRFARLEVEVKDLLKPKTEEKGWFFLSRVKTLESFALKIETGRVAKPDAMEDFVGGTIVVPTLSDVEKAEHLVYSLFDKHQRRPSDDASTHKPAYSFVFDDLRLYVKRRPPSSGVDPENDGAVFEVQIKTILQHAWSVATHDLIYKTDSVSWPRERIAFQVKAMLEHAEVAITEANRLADAPGVAKRDERTSEVLQTIEALTSIWGRDRLPNDVKRLAESLVDVLKVGGLRAKDLWQVIDDEKRRIGVLPSDLSPYSFAVQALSRHAKFEENFKCSSARTNIVVHKDMDMPTWVAGGHKRVIRL